MEQLKKKVQRDLASSKGINLKELEIYSRSRNIKRKDLEKVLNDNFAYISNKPYSRGLNPRRQYNYTQGLSLGEFQADKIKLIIIFFII